MIGTAASGLLAMIRLRMGTRSLHFPGAPENALDMEISDGAKGQFACRRLIQRHHMALTDRIEINPRVMLGKPVIRGTRIPVELILRKLSEGASESDLLEGYPSLKREDIQAAMRFAADTLAHEEVVFIGKGSAEHRD
jgi:uncharacterized protein (DUF433 family)